MDETDIPYVHNDSGDTQQDAITPKVDMGVRHLKSTLDSQGNAADTATGDATIKENTRIVEFSSNFKTVPRDMEARRRLAAVVEEGIEKAYKEDPDLYNKDQDIRLLVVSFPDSIQRVGCVHCTGITPPLSLGGIIVDVRIFLNASSPPSSVAPSPPLPPATHPALLQTRRSNPDVLVCFCSSSIVERARTRVVRVFE